VDVPIDRHPPEAGAAPPAAGAPAGRERGPATWRHLPVDYGGVLRLPQPPGCLAELAARWGPPGEEFLRRYRAHRPAYDCGQDPAAYWSAVAGRPIGAGGDRLTRLVRRCRH
jgi:hypothetical protein